MYRLSTHMPVMIPAKYGFPSMASHQILREPKTILFIPCYGRGGKRGKGPANGEAVPGARFSNPRVRLFRTATSSTTLQECIIKTYQERMKKYRISMEREGWIVDEDVLLINPPAKGVEIYEHLGLGYITACLRKNNIRVRIIDIHLNGWSISKAIQEVRKYPCKLIGISIPFQDFARQALNFATKLKKAGVNAHLSIGGIYPTFAYPEILEKFPAIDSVVLGEGEETFVELAQRILANDEWRDIKGIAYRRNGAVIKNEIRPSIKDLDEIPFPARDMLPRVLQKVKYASMITSRGCYGRCTFCSVVPFFSQFGPRFRVRSPENVVDEIEYLYKKYKVRNIMFHDANFIGNQRRAAAIAEEIIKRNLRLHYSIECRADNVNRELFRLLKASGLRRVFLGVESGSQAVLDRLQKDIDVDDNINALKILSELEIYVSMGFIMFDDRTTLEEFKDNIIFIQKAKEIMPPGKLDNVYIASKLLPLSGTEFERYLMEAKKYKGDSLNWHYRLDDPKVNLLYNALKILSCVTGKVHRILNIKPEGESKWLESVEEGAGQH